MPRLNYQSLKGSEFALAINWQLSVDLGGNSKLASLDGYPTDKGLLDSRCASAGVPTAELEMAPAKIRGLLLKQPIPSDPAGTITLVFFEKADWSLGLFFERWRDEGWDRHDGETTLRSDWFLPIWRMNMLDNKDGVKKTYVLENTGPQGVEITELGAESELVQVTLTLAYENFYIEKGS